MLTPDLPPGPGFLGSLRFVRRPLECLEACGARWGDWFTLRFPGVPPFVFTSDPAAVREVFTGDPDVLHAGEANRPLAAFMGEHSMLVLDGAAHERERRLLMPPFHGARMRHYATVMREVADRAIDAWPVGRPFPLHAQMQAIAFDVILRAVLGLDGGPHAAPLKDALARLFAYFSSGTPSTPSVGALRHALGATA